MLQEDAFTKLSILYMYLWLIHIKDIKIRKAKRNCMKEEEKGDLEQKRQFAGLLYFFGNFSTAIYSTHIPLQTLI
jgi:hypothetical protein